MIFENFQRNVSFQVALSINTNTNIRSISEPLLSPPQLNFTFICFSATAEEFSVQESWARLLFSAGFGTTFGRTSTPSPRYQRKLAYGEIIRAERLSKGASLAPKGLRPQLKINILIWRADVGRDKKIILD